MQKGKKMITIIFIFTVLLLGLSLVIISMRYINLKQRYNIQLEKYQKKEDTLQLLQQEEIQGVLLHVK
jgi:hypothetical protein